MTNTKTETMERDVKARTQRSKLKNNKGILIIYTGGTIGSMPKDINDPDSPQIVVPWPVFEERTPELSALPFTVDGWAMEPPLDSCNVALGHWQEIGAVIQENYDKYEGFVILHGTDSMVYTATALSFMLVNLSKPVVVTGAQRTHLFQSRNDGLQNMLSAIEIANPKAYNHPVIPEVVLFFQQDILRGSRARKLDAAGLKAYTSPNYPPLGRVEVSVEFDRTRIRPVPDSQKSFYVRRLMNPNVVSFDVYPGIQNSHFVERMLDDPSLRGVIIRAFGAGNIPTKPEFLRLFEDACKRGVSVQVVTQCLQGGVALGLYETSADLLNIGMCSGTDLTPEAAMVKMMVGLALEEHEDDPRALKRYLETNQVGEQSTSIYSTELKAKPVKLAFNADDPQTGRKRLPVVEPIASSWTIDTLNSVQFRLWRAQVGGKNEDAFADFDVYIDLASEEQPDRNSPKYAGTFKRQKTRKPSILQLDITDAFSRIANPGARPSFTIVLGEASSTLSFDAAEVALFVEEV